MWKSPHFDCKLLVVFKERLKLIVFQFNMCCRRETMSFLWLFPLFIAQLAVALVKIYPQCNNLSVQCPSPIRPKHVLDNYDYSDQSDFMLMLNLIECNERSTEKNYTFVKMFMMIDFKTITTTPFGKNLDYRRCPTCQIQISTDELTAEDHIHVLCDQKKGNCTILNWNCDDLTQEKFGQQLMEMVQESVMKKPMPPSHPSIDFLPLCIFFCIFAVFGIVIVIIHYN